METVTGVGAPATSLEPVVGSPGGPGIPGRPGASTWIDGPEEPGDPEGAGEPGDPGAPDDRVTGVVLQAAASVRREIIITNPDALVTLFAKPIRSSPNIHYLI
ncbi:MAG: hypothetical protein OXI88_03405 [Gammaproteobacteria bacterium]|nr:hypothetical protein [Gammaproteobacteria bacterium]